MTSSAAGSAVVQKFKPTGGAVVGYASLAILGASCGLAAVTEPNLFGLRMALVLLLLMLLAWVALLRPRADATREVLRLRNLLSDHHLPLAEIDEVAVRQVLYVWVGGERYACVGIGRSARQLLGNRRKRGPMAFLGVEQTEDRMGVGRIGDVDTSGDYAAFVETRIEDLARTARRDRVSAPPVRRVWARTEITGLVGVGTALVVSLLL